MLRYAWSHSILRNIWYVSDDGSDNNDCHSKSAPYRNLQTVLDRATDGADIYVISQTLLLDSNINKCLYGPYCLVDSSLSYNLYGLYGMVQLTCKGRSYSNSNIIM